MTAGKTKMNNKRIHIELFNKIVNIGDEVYYFDDGGFIKKDIVRCPASKMDSKTSVMWLKEAGSYLLSRFISKGETANAKKLELIGRMKQLQEDAKRLSEDAKQEFIVFHDAEAKILRKEFNDARRKAVEIALQLSDKTVEMDD